MLIPLSEYIWGRPVEKYVGSYGTHASQIRETHSPKLRQLAEAAVHQICYYSEQSGADLKAMEVIQRVSLETLDIVLKMSHDPDTYKLFLSPKLASGCITLMETVRSGEKSLPFYYEYGYLCFRILLLSLGISILSRLRGSAEKTLEMMKDPQYAICLITDIFSARVAVTLYGFVEEVHQESDCDWILGWGVSTSHPRYNQIVSQEQARILVDMIWEDRVNFLRVMSLTFTPALSVLAFLNWRYAYLENKAANPDPDLLKRASEIHWRCMLVAPTNQECLVMKITDHFLVLSKFVPGRGTSMFEKSLDPRGVTEAYILRLAPFNLMMYDPFPSVMLPVLLEIVVPNLESSHEDLIPTLFRLTLKRLWEALRGEKLTYSPLIACIGLTLEQLKLMFKSLREINISRPIIAKVLEELAQGDFLDFIASLLLSLNPNAEDDTPEDNTNFRIFHSAQAMIEELASSTSLDLLELHFRECTVSLAKVYHHFSHLWSVTNPRDRLKRRQQRDKHFDTCMTKWTEIVQTFGQNSNIRKAAEASADCGYALCPDPEGNGVGAYYACPLCFVVAYCSTRCQAGDWERGSHRKTCGKLSLTETYTPHNLIALMAHIRNLATRM